LKKIGFKIEKPAGAFYLWLDVAKKIGLSGDDFALRLLKQERVAVVPGSAFGDEFRNFVRISYATGFDELELALERIAKFVKNLK
jgi:aminotransferase